MSFSEAIEDSGKFKKRHLILGNGFSIGCFPNIFRYNSLFENANFTNTEKLKTVFDSLDTRDFEVVVRSLENSALLLPSYLSENSIIHEIMDHANKLREILINTISKSHPETPSDISRDQYVYCQKFLGNFLSDTNKGNVYTLNYDLLLYWVTMQDNYENFWPQPNDLLRADGFGNVQDEVDSEYLVWQGKANSRKQYVHYLHGALHLFDAGDRLKKYAWSRSGRRLVEQSRIAIERNEFPLFVSEGESLQKMEKIQHHPYLHRSFRTLRANAEQKEICFFIFGHSLADNDSHILEALSQGCFPKLYVGIFGDPNEKQNRLMIRRSQNLAHHRSDKNPLEVSFYCSNSANVWGNNDG